MGVADDIHFRTTRDNTSRVTSIGPRLPRLGTICGHLATEPHLTAHKPRE